MILETKVNYTEKKPVANPYKATNMKIIEVKPNPKQKVQILPGALLKSTDSKSHKTNRD